MANQIDVLDDTAPALRLSDDAAEDFGEAPTRPGVRLDAAAPIGADLSRDELDAARDKHWDRALRAVAQAVRRVIVGDGA